MRCPACGARNADGAPWCTQCFAGLSGSAAPPAEVPPPAPAAVARPTVPSDGGGRDVRTVDGEVEWRCGACDRWTPLWRDRCATCGSPRTGFGEAPPRREVPAGRRPLLAAASLVVPGLGHLLAGRTGTGLARAVLGLSWLLGGLSIARAAGASSASPLPAVPLLLGAVVVWVGSLADVLTLDRRELLRPRVLTVLTAVVLGTLVLGLLATASGGSATR